MTCCGPTPHEITCNADVQRIYLCPICGKQGGECDFPDPQPEAPATLTWREKCAEYLYRLADWIQR